MRATISAVVLFWAVMISGCLSLETKRNLAEAINRVDLLTAAVQVAEANQSSDLEALRAQLTEAKASLAIIETKAIEERVGDAASKVETGVGVASPLVAWAFPPALVALNMIGAVAGFLSNKYGRKA